MEFDTADAGKLAKVERSAAGQQVQGQEAGHSQGAKPQVAGRGSPDGAKPNQLKEREVEQIRPAYAVLTLRPGRRPGLASSI